MIYKEKNMAKHDAIIISDIHLSSNICQAEKLWGFLKLIHNGEMDTSCLILNGDIFDNWDFRKMKKSHWEILKLLRKIAGQIKVIVNLGNHDEYTEPVAHILGLDVHDDFSFISGRKISIYITATDMINFSQIIQY